MKRFRFLDWKVYKHSKELFAFTLKIVRKIPKEYRYEIGSQLIRSSLSVVLNIAEGAGKNSDKELNHFFDISLGSLFEVFATADVLRENKLMDDSDFSTISEYVESIGDQLGGFKKSIKSGM